MLMEQTGLMLKVELKMAGQIMIIDGQAGQETAKMLST